MELQISAEQEARAILQRLGIYTNDQGKAFTSEDLTELANLIIKVRNYEFKKRIKKYRKLKKYLGDLGVFP